MASAEGKRVCERLYEELCTCSVEKDRDGLESILADDYVLVHITGMRQSKDDYIRAVLDGTLNYYSFEHEGIDAEITDDGMAAHIRGRSIVDAAVFGGARHTWHLQQDLLAKKQGGSWKLEESKASTY